eukprot:UN17089
MKCAKGFRVMVNKMELGILRVSHTYIERGELFLAIFNLKTEECKCQRIIAELKHTEEVQNVKGVKIVKYIILNINIHKERLPLI